LDEHFFAGKLTTRPAARYSGRTAAAQPEL